MRSPALAHPGKALLQIGTVAALALACPGLLGAGRRRRSPASPAMATGLWLKFALVTRASLNQGFDLPHLPVRGAR